MSRNTWFGVGGVLLAVVLFVGFCGEDDPSADGDEVAASKKKNKKKKKGRKRKKRDHGGAVEAGGLGIAKLCAKLDCSEAQLSSFKGMVKEHRKQTSAQRRGLAEAHAKIAAELAESTLDTAALDAAFADAHAQRDAIDADARGVLEAMHGKLATAQREALAKLVARHGPTMLLARPADGPSKSGKRKRKGKKGRRKGKKGKKGKKGLKLQTRVPAAADTEGDGLAAPPIELPQRSPAQQPDEPEPEGEEPEPAEPEVDEAPEPEEAEE